MVSSDAVHIARGPFAHYTALGSHSIAADTAVMEECGRQVWGPHCGEADALSICLAGQTRGEVVQWTCSSLT